MEVIYHYLTLVAISITVLATEGIYLPKQLHRIFSQTSNRFCVIAYAWKIQKPKCLYTKIKLLMGITQHTNWSFKYLSIVQTHRRDKNEWFIQTIYLLSTQIARHLIGYSKPYNKNRMTLLLLLACLMHTFFIVGKYIIPKCFKLSAAVHI